MPTKRRRQSWRHKEKGPLARRRPARRPLARRRPARRPLARRRPFQGSPTTRSQAQKTRSAGRRRGHFLIRLYTAGFYRPVGFRGERPSSLEECGRCGGGDGGNRGHERFEREAKSSVISFCTRLSRATGIDEAMLARFTVAPRHSVTALHRGKGRRARCGNSSPLAYHNTHAVCRKRTNATACERRSTSRVGNPIGWVGDLSMSRRRVNISVSPEALELLDRLQQITGLNRSALLELLVREEAARRGAVRRRPRRKRPR